MADPMFVVIWPCLAGVIIIVLGLIAAPRSDKLLLLGSICFAAPLAVFGTEHLVSARSIAEIVPAWMPVRIFWAYFVGVALIAAGASIVLAKQVRLAAILLGSMFLLFVLLVHIPNVVKSPHDRILWAIVLRDLSFAGGAWSLAGAQTQDGRSAARMLSTLGRFFVSFALLFFAVEHFLHPDFVPVVPLGKMMPSWVPAHALLDYLTGAAELAAGACMLANKYVHKAASWLGILCVAIVLVLYVPIFALDKGPSQLVEGMNYVFDTLLFAGTVILVAAPLRHRKGLLNRHVYGV
jgi:uncharacterized membrane protein